MSNTQRTLPISTLCPLCCRTSVVNVPVEGYNAWRSGELIQEAMPELSADDREQLISGICPSCWSNLYGDDDE